ncbi:uncharacterized protein A1O5_10389 [Cladophialophora psammophila CBS 110553]|uniref:Heterokaryon incompatibility domain-containing protein n=1 Tax=Cladophialophora psammophila CBS 110553 TaxID=1182543 RepID=W9WDQ2_9EURO|nr:uncharacterized protein A1O5_10389 [Cladophialophora psammophila CBS 110553]EXJ66237.1 hypothetical protein A1O5_10389 [Cladophialophora psammophila CBS 110553]
MPARLVEITGTSETISLRLRQTEEVGSVPFAALSYCWGGEQPMKCDSSNVVLYVTAIPFEKQPQTIKDAARVCQGMGFQYLWIDALCIIQENSTEKSVEIAKMTSIYGSAMVTVVAARSSSATEGFLGERFPGPKKGALVPYRCFDGELGSITLVKLDDGFESVEPVDERDEMDMLQQQDLRAFLAKGLTDGWKRDANYSSKRKTEALNLENIRTAKSTIGFYGRPRNSQFKQYLNAMQHWEKICETFTQRALTLSSDRALAISGIAQIFIELSGDKYIAGLWKSYLHSGLLWKIEHSHVHPKNIPRPTTYQGPSWAWLSVNGPVQFGQVSRPSECIAEILSCETEPANETAPYGLIREGSGRLVIAARTAPASRTKTPLRSPGRFKDEVMILGFGKSFGKPFVCHVSTEMRCDVQEAEIDAVEQTAGCLVVEITRRTDRDNKLCCQGLVLRWSSPERKTYSRVGRFTYYGDRKGRLFAEHVKAGQPAEVEFDWFADEPKVIEII